MWMKLHSYTIKKAIHDEAVLGFMVEILGVKDLSFLYRYSDGKHSTRSTCFQCGIK